MLPFMDETQIYHTRKMSKKIKCVYAQQVPSVELNKNNEMIGTIQEIFPFIHILFTLDFSMNLMNEKKKEKKAFPVRMVGHIMCCVDEYSSQ